MLKEIKSALGGKSKLLISVFLLIAVTAFIFNNSKTEINKLNTPPALVGTGQFLHGAISNQADYDLQYITDPAYFGMNLWHTYSGWRYDSSRSQWLTHGWGDDQDRDSLFADSNTYFPAVKNYLDKYAEHPMKMLMHRPKIVWLCYGQRSDYQCEPIEDTSYYWFYSFQQHLTGESITDSGHGVIHCRAEGNGPTYDDSGYVVKRLKANNEQNNIFPGDHWDDSQWKWYVKPRIRIDSNMAHSPQNPLVCKIKVIGSDNSVLKDVDIRASYFLVDEGQYYNGRYIEEFDFPVGTNLQIHGAWGANSYYGWWCARGNDSTDGLNKTDIQVYWYGNCDMWIDYVRVDNEIADGLFNINAPLHNTFDQWLQWEADVANYDPQQSFKPQYRFYLEELDLNNVPCIGYVNQKLQQLTSPDTVDMTVCFYWSNFAAPVGEDYLQQRKWSSSHYLDAQTINQVFIQPAHLREFYTEIYPFTCNNTSGQIFSKVPYTLPEHDEVPCNFAEAVAPSVYDTWLQNQLDQAPYPSFSTGDPGWFTWAIKAANTIAKDYGTEFITMPQAHLVRNGNIENRREPTNEEIRLITNLSLSYGTKGIMYFWYSGIGSCGTTNSFIGYLDGGAGSSQQPRTENAFGENKWDSLIAIHKKIRQWGPYFLSFNTQYTNSYIYYRELQDCLAETYFSDIVTYYPSAYPTQDCAEDAPGETPPQNWQYDCKAVRYLQVATFKNTNEANPNYFMIVNRRCSPYRPEISENGGMRKVRVKFDVAHNDLQGYSEWTILDMANDSWSQSFNKTLSQYVDLGEFMPGEGRLYHLVPKAVTGGTLLADEVIESGENFTCQDTLWTNGHDLTIEDGVTIHFTDTSKFVVNGGTFQIGDPDHSGSNTIVMDGDQSGSFKGFEF
jgi:hypothetical protein